MPTIPVAVVGAGQAGLAVSQVLGEAGIDHVVLERGHVAERWRARRRWRSLRLLTPNWMTRLPGRSYDGPDPDGYMTADEVVGFLGGYAASLPAPVVEHAEVRSVRRNDVGYGSSPVPAPGRLRRSSSQPAGPTCPGSPTSPRPSTGVCTSSPPITTAIPPTYRTAACWSSAPQPPACSSPTNWREPAVQSPSLSDITRACRGATAAETSCAGSTRSGSTAAAWSRCQIRPRWCGNHRCSWPAGPTTATCTWPRCRLSACPSSAGSAAPPETGSSSPPTFPPPPPQRTCGCRRLLTRIDRHADAPHHTGAPHVPPVATGGAATDLNLRTAGIRTIVWATGYRRAYPWLHVPVLDPAGEIRHHRGRTPAPGLFVVGANWQSHRGSMTLDGVGHDATQVAAHAIAHLAGRPTSTVAS